jgi:hypothetical protein
MSLGDFIQGSEKMCFGVGGECSGGIGNGLEVERAQKLGNGLCKM